LINLFDAAIKVIMCYNERAKRIIHSKGYPGLASQDKYKSKSQANRAKLWWLDPLWWKQPTQVQILDLA
jgi:hypothetical protein